MVIIIMQWLCVMMPQDFYLYDLITDVFVLSSLVLFYYQWTEAFNLYIERRFIECLEGTKKADLCNVEDFDATT